MIDAIAARVVRIFELESFTDREGQTRYSRQILLETDERFPQRLVVTASKEMASNFPYPVGSLITAHVSFDAFPSKDETRYFNKIRVWRIEAK